MRNGQRELFGTERIRQRLEADCAHYGEAQLSSLLQKAALFGGEDWEQEDDITLLALYRLPVRP